MARLGRPKKELDADQVYSLAAMGCTRKEIAAFFGVHVDTLRDNYSSQLTVARAKWKMSIRRAQTVRAVKDRSDSMLIHLGRTYLGQVPREATSTLGDEVLDLAEKLAANSDADLQIGETPSGMQE